MGLLDQWNKNKFSIYKSEEKTVLKLIEEIGKWIETLIKGLDGKTDLYGDHKGSWQGLNRPTLSEEGMRATVEKLDSKYEKLEKDTIILSNYKLSDNTWDEVLDLCLLKDGCILIDENITLEKSHYIDIMKNRLKSYGKTITYNGASPLFNITSSQTGKYPYSQNRVIIDGINFIGTLNANDFLIADNTTEGVGASRFVVKNCSMQLFNNVITTGKNVYLYKFINCEIFNNNLAFNLLDKEDSGENIIIDKCAIFNNSNAFKLNNGTSDVRVINTSIDYNTQNIVNILKGRIYFTNCHFEHKKTIWTPDKRPFVVEDVDGNHLEIKESEIIFLGDKGLVDYFFYNKKTTDYSGIKIKDCFIYGLESNTKYIGYGYIDISGTKSFSWENNSSFASPTNNKIHDPKFLGSNIKRNNFLITSGGTITDWYNSTNVTLGINGTAGSNSKPCLQMNKVTDTGTSAIISLAIPVREGDLPSAFFVGKTTVSSEVTIKFQYGNMVNNNLIIKETFYTLSKREGTTWANNMLGAENRKPCPVGCSYFIISIDLTKMAAGTRYYIDEIEMATM